MIRYGYYHIEKTGGSWVREVFREAGWSITVDGNPYCDGDRRELHIAQNEPLEDVDYSFTLLRYPPSRLLSYYNYSISTGIGVHEGWESQPSLDNFLDTLDWDRDYGDMNRHHAYPQHYGSATMPYRSMCYTLELLGAGGDTGYYSIDDPDFLYFLQVNGCDPSTPKVNSSKPLSLARGITYKDDYTPEEWRRVIKHPLVVDDLYLWRELTNYG